MAKINSENKQNFPNEPWRWRDDWESLTLVTTNRSAMIGTIIFAVIWNAVAWPLTILILPDELHQNNYAALLVLIFPVVGVCLLAWAFVSARRYLKYGESTFRIGSNPGIVGGALVGVVDAGRQLQPTEGFRVQLSCVSREVHGTGKNRRVRQNILWQSVQTVHRDLGASGQNSVIPVQFAIPFDAKSSSPDSLSESRICWKLEVRSSEPGIDYLVNFEVPVFMTGDSDPNFQLDPQFVADYIDTPSIDAVYEEARLVRRETLHGIEIESPLFRDLGKAVGTTIFTSVWIGATIFFWHGTRGAGGISLFTGLFVGVFALFGVLMALITVELWLWRAKNKITENGIESKAGIIGLARTRTFPIDAITDLKFKKGMQSGMTVFYDLNLETASGKQHSLARRIANEAAARRIIEDIEVHLGVATVPAEAPAARSNPNIPSTLPLAVEASQMPAQL